MSDAVQTYPDTLTPAWWDKKKGSLPSACDLPDKLKALQKKHGAIDWKPFDAAWSKACGNATELEQAFAQRDRIYRGSVFALKRDANDIASAALRLAKDKASAKITIDAAKTIAGAANDFSDAVDTGVEALRKTLDQALKAMPAQGNEGGEGEGDDEAGSVLLDPGRLLAQLKLCKRDPERRVNFGFVESKDKLPAVLALHPKMSARKLFAKLQSETGVKAGAFGTAWVDDTTLILQPDKPLGGLVKKLRAPLRECGFRVAKVVIWNADGTVFEQDDEAPEAASASTETAAPDSAASDDQRSYASRWAALEPRTLQALKSPQADASKLRAVSAFATEKAQGGNFKAALQGLDTLEKLLGATTAAATSTPTAVSPAQAQALAAFNARLTALTPRIKAAIAAGADPALRAQAGEAVADVRKQDFEGAARRLDAIDASLAASPAATAKPAVAAAPAGGSRVAYTKARLAWDQTRKQIQAELRQLEASILDQAQNEPDFAEIKLNAGVVYSVMDVLDDELIDKLDEALNASTEAERSKLQAQASELVNDYLDFVKTDELLRDIVNNGFVKLAVLPTLEQRLNDLAQKLGTAVAA